MAAWWWFALAGCCLVLTVSGGYDSDALKTLKTDKFLVVVVQVADSYRNRYDKLQEIWKSVPRDPTKYYDTT